MAKNLSGDLRSPPPTVWATASWCSSTMPASGRTRLDRAAVARDKRAAEILLERARAEAFTVVDPFLVAVTEDDDGTLEPLSLREKIRASGLTFDAIAAEAVRYA